MHQAVQLRQPVRPFEHLRRQPGPVDRAIRRQHTRPELADHGVVRLRARHQHLVPKLIGLDQVAAEVRQRLSHEALAGGQSARQPYAKHAFLSSRSAASMVFTMSMAMVSGPTPPGTGV